MSVIEVITPLFASARAQINERFSIPNTYGHFLTIDSDDNVERHHLIANTVFYNRCWTICAIRSLFQSYGWQTNYEVFAIVNKDGQVVRQIPLDKWVITTINFLPVREGNNPIPVITFALKSDFSQTFELKSYTITDFKDVWRFFLEIDQYCISVNEVKLYKDYFELKLLNTTLATSLEEYKQELEEKRSLISEYKSLLERIDSLTKSLQ